VLVQGSHHARDLISPALERVRKLAEEGREGTHGEGESLQAGWGTAGGERTHVLLGSRRLRVAVAADHDFYFLVVRLTEGMVRLQELASRSPSGGLAKHGWIGLAT
jgi:hypothetical protein